MTSGTTYEEAIRFASAAHNEFYAQYELVNRRKEQGLGNDELTRAMERHEAKLAAAACAQAELIQFMFGVSEERVHEDLEAIRAEGRAA